MTAAFYQRIDFDRLERMCCELNQCGKANRVSARSSGHTRKAKRLERRANRISRIRSIVQSEYQGNPNQSSGELTESVLTILAPWILRFLISAFERAVVNWFINEIYRKDEP